MNRRKTLPVILAVVFIAIALIAGIGTVRPHFASLQCKNCNVIFLDIDTLRADELPCTGYGHNTAPNICAFSRKGTLFTRNISQDNWTLPSLMATLTSLYTDYHRMVLGQGVDKLNPSIPTLAEYFKDNKYGTWLLSQYAASYLPGPENQAMRGYAHREHGSDVITLFKNTLSKQAAANNPFFMHVYIDTLHSPYSIGDRANALYPVDIDPTERNRIPVTQAGYRAMIGEYLIDHPDEVFLPETRVQRPELFTGDRETRKKRMADYFFSDFCNGWTCSKRWNVELSQLMTLANTPESLRYLRMMYDTRLHELDTQLAPVFAYLESSGLIKRTIIVIASSHGEEFKEHGGLAHENTSYEELIRTPLVIVAPHANPRKISALTENIDIMPTLLTLTGIAPRGPMQGVSLIPLMQGSRIQRDYAISGDLSITGVASIEQNRWKLVRTLTGRLELFDLARDPREQHDVADRYPHMLSRMEKLLTQKLTAQNPYPPVAGEPTPVWLDPETKARLIRDGYF